MKYTQLIEKRISVRSFQKEKFDHTFLKKVDKVLKENSESIFGTEAKFQIVEKSDINDVKLGTYGFIDGADNFIIGYTKDEKLSLIDYGFRLQKIILDLTHYDIGTCWLGGTFTRKKISKSINLKEDEIIPAITPVGIAKENRTLKEKFMRKAAGSDKRKSIDEICFEGSFNKPIQSDYKGVLLLPLHMLRLAPSASNKQPWRILIEKNFVHFYLQRTQGYDKIIPGIDLQMIDMGIAQAHFELSVRELGLRGYWSIENKDDFDNKEYLFSWSINQSG